MLDLSQMFLCCSNRLPVSFHVSELKVDDPEGAFVNTLSMEEKRQLLRTLGGESSADASRKKAKKDKKAKKEKKSKKDKKKKAKKARSRSSSSDSDSDSDSDRVKRRKEH